MDDIPHGAPAGGTAGSGSRDIYSVTRLNREARAVLEGSFPPLWVQGEISNLARPSSGHLYFSLKDAHSQVRCAMFKGRNRLLRFTPENGMEVLARGAVSLYEGRGEFQLIVELLEPAGEGALQRAFEELKQRLFKEGLFDEALKKNLPVFPHCIGVVTSSSGAAIRDILIVLGRRWPVSRVIVYPTPVQGTGAGEKIAAAIATAAERSECDVLILARGGGSLEDLWAFNEEVVARAIHACGLPVVTGIGHEIDFTIADFAADRRAPTPSAAAEMVTPDRFEVVQRVINFEAKILARVREFIRQHQRMLSQLRKRLPHPARLLQSLQQRCDDLSLHLRHAIRQVIAARRSSLFETGAKLQRHNPRHTVRLEMDRCRWLKGRLRQATQHGLRSRRDRLAAVEYTLRAVSPLATLERGYAIVMDRAGTVVRNAASLVEGDPLRARFAKGEAEAKVTRVRKK